MKTKANFWKNSRADQWKAEKQLFSALTKKITRTIYEERLYSLTFFITTWNHQPYCSRYFVFHVRYENILVDKSESMYYPKHFIIFVIWFKNDCVFRWFRREQKQGFFKVNPLPFHYNHLRRDIFSQRKHKFLCSVFLFFVNVFQTLDSLARLTKELVVWF